MNDRLNPSGYEYLNIKKTVSTKFMFLLWFQQPAEVEVNGSLWILQASGVYIYFVHIKDNLRYAVLYDIILHDKSSYWHKSDFERIR